MNAIAIKGRADAQAWENRCEELNERTHQALATMAELLRSVDSFCKGTLADDLVGFAEVIAVFLGMDDDVLHLVFAGQRIEMLLEKVRMADDGTRGNSGADIKIGFVSACKGEFRHGDTLLFFVPTGHIVALSIVRKSESVNQNFRIMPTTAEARMNQIG